VAEINRRIIVSLALLLLAGAAAATFLAWAANSETITRLEDFVQYLTDHNDGAGRLIVTLGALTLVILAALIIVVEVTPSSEPEGLHIKQQGGITIVPIQVLRDRLEEVLLDIPVVRAAKVRPEAHHSGVSLDVDLWVEAGSNLAEAGQAASRRLSDVLAEELGLPLVEPARVRVIPVESRPILTAERMAPAGPAPAEAGTGQDAA